MSPSARMTAAFGIGRRPATWLSCAKSPSTSWVGTEHPGSACGRVASRPPGMTSTCSLFWLDDFMRRPWSGSQVDIGADLGTRRGDNLFHSFEKFGIAPGQTATFTGPGAIRNVISRVTGGEISNIDGTLRSTVGQADLYFLNPAGVMFGPNATLDVPGSFHVSTAHELRFADGASFSALDKA